MKALRMEEVKSFWRSWKSKRPIFLHTMKKEKKIKKRIKKGMRPFLG